MAFVKFNHKPYYRRGVGNAGIVFFSIAIGLMYIYHSGGVTINFQTAG